ncbi:MAG: NAD-dependent succinate-semialdehyde dehydrogenase, partial [Geminicoccaceae bacterium]|nr:NAD-dependent succinate-semialdehyde dehydrogenase [Geminicoccaceae bacterium]
VVGVTNPATGARLGVVPALGAPETEAAIAAAAQALPAWRKQLPQDKARLLRRWHDLMVEAKEDLALLMTLEQGKPLTEAQGEIDYAASFIAWFAEETMRVNVEGITPHLPNRQMTVKREPVGVAALITPWNVPSAMITRKAAAALAAGCPVVVRPASETPFSALALAELADRAGFPAGLFSVVTGPAEPIVGAMMASEIVRAVSFTGSTGIGRKLLEQGAATVKRMSMELGGHAPMLIFPEVDLDDAVAGAIAAKFQTSGQDCLAANRIYVHDSIYDAFVTKFAAAAKALRVGNGLDDGVEIGPLMHDRAVRKCEQHVQDALHRGGRLLAGGNRLGGTFFAPTVIADASDDMLIASEETFGPVAPIFRFSSEDEVVRRANDTIYGLAAYVWSDDAHRVARVTEALEYGMVAVNCVKMTGAPVPFGGMKQSGLGREGSRHGLEEFTELKYVCLQVKGAA